mmetsp:Transcript_41756/g.110312  ORF Transcript_41756/g.110312 Transcript_41756/m.110312 type:complete len:300 (+) Transcript_41756:1119-2018(+)
MTAFAAARACNSSPRDFVSSSKSDALLMQLWCRSSRLLMSSVRSFFVMERSPSAVAFVSPASALSFFAASMSFLANFSLSSRDCFSIWKLCARCSSVFRRSSSCPSDFSRRLSIVSTMLPPLLLYASGSGAPRAASSELSSASLSSALAWDSSSVPAFCRSAVSFGVLSELRELASTMAVSACARLAAFLIWTSDAELLFISRSRMEMARSSMSTVSISSCSSLPKTFTSMARIRVAAFRSASSAAMAEDSSSIFVDASSMTLVSFSILAFKSPSSALPILISFRISTERSSHHSENSS